MSERKINLEEILNKYLASRTSLEVDYDDYVFIKRAMFEACCQILELAAENTEVEYEKNSEFGSYDTVVNKQSILDTIKQVK